MSDPAATIEEVIERLKEIIDQSKSNQSRLGYFAALYRKVTCRGRSASTKATTSTATSE